MCTITFSMLRIFKLYQRGLQNNRHAVGNNILTHDIYDYFAFWLSGKYNLKKIKLSER